MACVFNFSGAEHSRYRLGLPHAGRWREILNTDATTYNGSGIGNMGGVDATDQPWHGRPASAGAGATTDVGTVAGPRITQQPLTLRVRFVSTIRERAVRDDS